MQPKKRFDVRFSVPLWWPSLPIDWRTWLPSRGNILFTLLMLAGLLGASSAGALPLGAPSAASSSTGTVAYQGRLADASGNPVTATVPMIFRLYNMSTGGAPLWEEQWTGSNSVRISDGLFNVMLGSLTAIPQNVVTGNNNLWLGITVNADNEMQPRVQLGSVPFAVQALTVPDGSITAAKLAPDVSLVPPDGSVTTAKLADDAVTPRKMHMVFGQAGYSGGSLDLTTAAQEIPGSRSQFTLDTNAVIMITATFDTVTSSSGATTVGQVAFDGTFVGRQALLSGTGIRSTTATTFAINVTPGTHTLSLYTYANGSTGSKLLDHTGYTYFVVR